MADTKISALTTVTAAASTDIFAVVQGGTTKGATLTQIQHAKIVSGTATATIHASVDDIVIESSQGECGVSIVSSDTTATRLAFGISSLPWSASLQWADNVDILYLQTLHTNANIYISPGNNVNAMVLTSNSNVGIGTTGPGCKLQVAGVVSGTSISAGDGITSTFNAASSNILTITSGIITGIA